MDHYSSIIFESATFYQLCCLLAAALFFFMAGVRELKNQCLEGLLYITLGLFFTVAHAFYLFNLPIDNPMSFIVARMDIWGWIALILAPSLIGLFLLFGLYSFIRPDPRAAMVKIFFGLTLLCYLFMIGSEWPVDVKGILTLIWCWMWFEVELRTAH